jgi:hypothetical protein
MSVTSGPQTQTLPLRRRRRWPIYVALFFLLLIGGPLGYYFYVAWALTGSTAAAVAETDRLDPRWRLADMDADRKVYAPEENSALQVIKVVALIGNRSPTAHRDYEDAFEGLLPQHQLTAEQIDIIRGAFDGLGEGLAEARKLKDMPGGRFALKWSPDWISTILPDQQNARTVIGLLQHDAMLRAQDGDPDLALESCMALVNAGRALGDEPLLISFLIRCAGGAIASASVERILAQGFPTEAPMAELQKRLKQERGDVDAHFLNGVRGERAGTHQLFEAIADGKVKIGGVMGMMKGGGQPSLPERLLDHFPVILTKDYPSHLRHMTEIVEIAKLPLEQRLDKYKAQDEELRRSASLLTRLLAPAVQKVAQASLRIPSKLAAVEVALACERFRLEHKRWPETLDELVKAGKLEAVPADPMDGRPLRYRRLADGVVIYSLGGDKQDNQGALHPDNWHQEGGDWGVRLWDPGRRRQPPRMPGKNGAP